MQDDKGYNGTEGEGQDEGKKMKRMRMNRRGWSVFGMHLDEGSD